MGGCCTCSRGLCRASRRISSRDSAFSFAIWWLGFISRWGSSRSGTFYCVIEGLHLPGVLKGEGNGVVWGGRGRDVEGLAGVGMGTVRGFVVFIGTLVGRVGLFGSVVSIPRGRVIASLGVNEL